MHPLSADQLIRVWEQGQPLHTVDRALILLRISCPDLSVEDIASLTVGQRDGMLLDLREMSFGNTLNCVAQCSDCGEPLEFTLDTNQLRVTNPSHTPSSEFIFSDVGYDGSFRLPNSYDLAHLASNTNREVAKAALLERCLLQATHNGISVSPQELPPQVVTHLATQMVELDPQAEILIDISCTVCQNEWQMMFDIVSFLWAELSAQVNHLLLEVHQLARHYSWHEADILAMTAMRRYLYLEMIG
jgi:hypothetical protein